ncbi:17530_t:CDS:2, partial [Acaulospora morrowiae]
PKNQAEVKTTVESFGRASSAENHVERKAKNELKYLKDTIIDLEHGMRIDTSDSNCSDTLPSNVPIKKIHKSKKKRNVIRSLNVDFVARSFTQTSDLLQLEGHSCQKISSRSSNVVGSFSQVTDCGCYIPNIADIVVLWELQSGLLIAVLEKAYWSCIIERWHM